MVVAGSPRTVSMAYSAWLTSGMAFALWRTARSHDARYKGLARKRIPLPIDLLFKTAPVSPRT